MSSETIPVGTVFLRPRGAREAKREAFVTAARDLFFAQGYAATAMSAIAAKVGGSKTTLWSYFPSKEDLFEAVVEDIATSFADALNFEFRRGESVDKALRRFGCTLMKTIQTPALVELQRLVTGEAGRFPELARIYWHRGPARGKEKLTQFIDERMVAGELREGDASVAARHFAGMCQTGPCQMHVLGLVPPLSQAERGRIVDAAVDGFMAAWSAS
jgi:AcrR family transcriptional regulator